MAAVLTEHYGGEECNNALAAMRGDFLIDIILYYTHIILLYFPIRKMAILVVSETSDRSTCGPEIHRLCS